MGRGSNQSMRDSGIPRGSSDDSAAQAVDRRRPSMDSPPLLEGSSPGEGSIDDTGEFISGSDRPGHSLSGEGFHVPRGVPDARNVLECHLTTAAEGGSGSPAETIDGLRQAGASILKEESHRHAGGSTLSSGVIPVQRGGQIQATVGESHHAQVSASAGQHRKQAWFRGILNALLLLEGDSSSDPTVLRDSPAEGRVFAEGASLQSVRDDHRPRTSQA